ncbi:MAG: MurR/RpiR family transcriptional regulator [Sneathiella sp.]|nr:MurR/RpiR family transcriptional regulator [Sneathiella sp.]
MAEPTFAERVTASILEIRPAEQRVARFFLDNREETLINSASSLAGMVGTSDATVIRTVKALGFSGMEELRRFLAADMRNNPTPSSRLARTLTGVGSDLISALDMTVDIHQKALERLRHDITPESFEKTVRHIVAAKRTYIFGIGPSSAMASYFSIQLERFGIEATPLTQTGLLLADQLLRLEENDLMMIFAYGRIYSELETILDHAARCNVPVILFSDTLGVKLRNRVEQALTVQRGRTDLLSMHTTTLGLIEALLLGIAKVQPEKALASLELLNELRASVSGKRMDLPAA